MIPIWIWGHLFLLFFDLWLPKNQMNGLSCPLRVISSLSGHIEWFIEAIFKEAIETENRGIEFGNFQVLRDTFVPSVLLELDWILKMKGCYKQRSLKHLYLGKWYKGLWIIRKIGIGFNIRLYIRPSMQYIL